MIWIRKRYTDLRFGLTAISPLLSFGTFVTVIYTQISDSIAFEIFLPLMIVGLLSIVTVVGIMFRTMQLKVDSTLNYEQQIEPARTTRILFDDLHKIQEQLGIDISDDSITRRKYMKNIEDSDYNN
jgi:hypothetical protein